MCKILTLRDDVIGHLVVAAEEVTPGALSLEVGVGAGRRLPKALMVTSGVTAKDGKTFRALPCQFFNFLINLLFMLTFPFFLKSGQIQKPLNANPTRSVSRNLSQKDELISC